MKIFKKTLFLLVILISLSIWYFYGKSKPEKKEKENLFLIEKDKIGEIIIGNGNRKIEIVNSNGTWIIKDKNYECDKNEVENLINKISSLEIERNLGEVENLEQYGLEDLSRFIEVVQNGKKFKLYIGDETPSGNYFYVTRDKKEILLVYKWDLNVILEKDIFELRDKRILPIDITKNDIEEIEIKKDKISYLVRRKGEIWNIENPLKDWAEKEKIEDLIEKIIDGKVKKYEEEKKEKECGLEKPKITIKIKDKTNQYFLHFGKKENDLYYAKNSQRPYIFLVEKDIIEKIPDEINQLREKKLFDFVVSDVCEFSIIKKDKELKIVKKNGDYYIEKDKTKKVSKEKVEDFLYDLKYLEIKDFVDYSETKLKKYLLSPPLIKISVLDNLKHTEIYFGEKTANEIYCFHPERKIIFTIPESDYPKIDKEEEFFIEKKEK